MTGETNDRSATDDGTGQTAESSDGERRESNASHEPEPRETWTDGPDAPVPPNATTTGDLVAALNQASAGESVSCIRVSLASEDGSGMAAVLDDLSDEPTVVGTSDDVAVGPDRPDVLDVLLAVEHDPIVASSAISLLEGVDGVSFATYAGEDLRPGVGDDPRDTDSDPNADEETPAADGTTSSDRSWSTDRSCEEPADPAARSPGPPVRAPADEIVGGAEQPTAPDEPPSFDDLVSEVSAVGYEELVTEVEGLDIEAEDPVDPLEGVDLQPRSGVSATGEGDDGPEQDAGVDAAGVDAPEDSSNPEKTDGRRDAGDGDSAPSDGTSPERVGTSVEGDPPVDGNVPGDASDGLFPTTFGDARGPTGMNEDVADGARADANQVGFDREGDRPSGPDTDPSATPDADGDRAGVDGDLVGVDGDALVSAFVSALDERDLNDEELATVRSALGISSPNSVRARVEHLATRVNELLAYRDALESIVEDGDADRSADVESDVESLESKVGSLATDVESLDAAVDDFGADLSAVRTDLEAIRSEVDDVRSDAGLRGDVDQLGVEVRDLTEWLESLAERTDALEDRLDEQVDQVASIAVTVERHDAALESQTDRAGSDDVGHAEGDLESAFEERFDRLDEQIEEIRGTLDAVETWRERLESALLSDDEAVSPDAIDLDDSIALDAGATAGRGDGQIPTGDDEGGVDDDV